MAGEPRSCVRPAEGRSGAWRGVPLAGIVDTPAGPVQLVPARLAARDVLGGWKARWGLGRDDYSLPPGLYGVGRPDSGSPVLVTANYKLSFDRLRRELEGVDAWILVLDTRGVNVWCAAGKGTFGTEELIGRVLSNRLAAIVSHRLLILPQLGAPGVAAHAVARRTGFRVAYGPVRAADLREYLRAGAVKTASMSRVEFPLADRLAVAPIEIVQSWKLWAGTFLAAALAGALERQGLDRRVLGDVLPFAGAVLAGTVATAALLPWIPFRAFSLKGAALGLPWAAFTVRALDAPRWDAAFLLLTLPAMAAFLAMNFTGATTFTSQAGVTREVRRALPIIVAAAAAGILAKVIAVGRGLGL